MLKIEALNPSKLGNGLYEELHAIGVVACQDAFLSQYPAEEYIGSTNDFIASHRDPNVEVLNPQGHRNNNQEYHHPLIFIAKMGQEIIGWAASAHNVSGGGGPEEPHNTSLRARLDRSSKRVLLTHNYLHLPEVYVDPSYQQRGVATGLLFKATKLRHLTWPIMPIAAYTYPDIYKPGKLNPSVILQEKGFNVTNPMPEDQLVTVPGLGRVRRLRLQHNSAFKFHQSLKK